MSESRGRNLRLAIAGVGLVLAGWWFFSWYTSPQRRIGRQLDRIQQLISKAPMETELTALGKARAATDLFASQFEFEAEAFDFHTRDRQQLIAGIHQYRSRAQTIRMQLPEKEISVAADHQRATSYVTALFITKMRDLAGREAYRFQINWLLENGAWRMDYVRLLEVINN